MKAYFKIANVYGGPVWAGNPDHAVLVDGGPDRVIGQYWHDGSGAWQVSIHVSYWRALKLIRERAGLFRGFRQGDGFARAERCDAKHHRRSLAHGGNAGPYNRNLLVERQRRGLTQRTARNDADATAVDHPAAVDGQRRVIDRQIGFQVGRDSGKNAFPVHGKIELEMA